MSQNLGIDHDCTGWQVPDWERGVRKRVAWAVFMQDKWGALIYGRSSNIRTEDWIVQPLTSLDFPETFKDDDDEEGSAEIEIGKQTFVHMISLTLILAEILDEFFVLNATQRTDALPDTLLRAKPIQLKLRSWFASLPDSLSIEETKPRRLTSVGYLHLAYYTAEVTLHRAILRSHSMLDVNTELLLISRRAAAARLSKVVEFVKRLKQEHLQSFWYFSSEISLAIIGVFAGVLVATSLDMEERESHLSLLAEYRWILRISNTSADFMKYSVTVLDTNGDILERQTTACLSNSPSVMQTSDRISDELASSAGGDVSLQSPIYADWTRLPALDVLHDFNYEF